MTLQIHRGRWWPILFFLSCSSFKFLSVPCSSLKFLTSTCSSLQLLADNCSYFKFFAVLCSSLQLLAVTCSYLKLFAVHCSSLTGKKDEFPKNNLICFRLTNTQKYTRFTLVMTHTEVLTCSTLTIKVQQT